MLCFHCVSMHDCCNHYHVPVSPSLVRPRLHPPCLLSSRPSVPGRLVLSSPVVDDAHGGRVGQLLLLNKSSINSSSSSFNPVVPAARRGSSTTAGLKIQYVQDMSWIVEHIDTLNQGCGSGSGRIRNVLPGSGSDQYFHGYHPGEEEGRKF